MEEKGMDITDTGEGVKKEKNNIDIKTSAEDSEAIEISEEEEEKKYESLKKEFDEINDKYLRLYAEFENYRKRVNKEKEDLFKYGSETIVYELLPVIDNLELALSHVQNDTDDSLVQGVKMTHNEMKKVLGKFGLSEIEAHSKPFDPQYHHAMSQVEREDVEDKTVVEEFRKGYMFKEKVLRPSLVSVSKKPEIKYNEEESKEKIEIKEDETNG